MSSTKLQEDKKVTRASYSNDTMSPTSTASEVVIPDVKYGPDWLIAAPEEINALIAQRHFEEALTLIKSCEDHFAKDNTFFNAREIAEKVSMAFRMLNRKPIRILN